MNDRLSPLLRISSNDNVVIAVHPLAAGTLLDLPGGVVLLDSAVGLGHKIAARDIAAGETIIKYNAAIGSAITAIRAGELVHLHNMKSDYLPTYLRGTREPDTHGH